MGRLRAVPVRLFDATVLQHLSSETKDGTATEGKDGNESIKEADKPIQHVDLFEALKASLEAAKAKDKTTPEIDNMPEEGRGEKGS